VPEKEATMLKRIPIVLSLGLILAACSGGPPPEPPAPPPFDPVGTYDFVAGVEGMEIMGSMVITGSEEEGYSGSLSSDMGGASMMNIAVDDQTVTFYIPDADADVAITFEGDEFTGTVTGSMGSGYFNGSKR
jgi:hypothetical protein